MPYANDCVNYGLDVIHQIECDMHNDPNYYCPVNKAILQKSLQGSVGFFWSSFSGNVCLLK